MPIRLLCLFCACLTLLGTVAASGPPRRGVDELLPPAALLRIGSLRWCQGGTVTALAFSKNDLALFAAGTGGPLRVWDPATGKELTPPGLPDVNVTAMSLAPGGRLLVVAGADRVVRVWDLETNRLSKQWPSGAGPCGLVAVSRNGKYVAWRHGDNDIHIRDLDADKDVHICKMPNEQLTCLAFSADTRHLVIGSFRLGGMLVEVKTGKRLRRHPPERQGRDLLLDAVFSKDGKHIIYAYDEGKYHVWETESMEEAKQLTIGTTSGAKIALSPDGKTLATGNYRGLLGTWSLETAKPIRGFDGLSEAVTALTFSGDGKTLVTGHPSGLVRLWDVATGKEKFKHAPRSPLVGVGFGRKADELVTVDASRLVCWSAKTGKELCAAKVSGSERFQSALVARDGEFAAVLDSNGLVRLINTARGTDRLTLKTNLSSGGLMALSPDGRLIGTVARTAANVVHLWDTRTGKERLPLKTPAASLRHLALAFSPDSRTVLTGHPDPCMLQRWELTTSKPRVPARLPDNVVGMSDPDMRSRVFRAALAPPGASVTAGVTVPSLSIAPDGKLYALPWGDKVHLCDPLTGKVIRQLESGMGYIANAVFSPDGRYLATSSDRVIQLWEVGTGRLRGLLKGHRGPVSGLAFSPDGKRLLSGAGDATALLWDVEAAIKAPVAAAPPAPLRPVETLWQELASDDAAVAETALRQLLRTPAATVALLRRHLRPVAGIDPARLERLLGDLDSGDVGVRDRATQQLEELGEQAEAALRTLERSPSAEVRRRVARLLDRLDRPQASGPQARALRAVELLEQLATREARQLLTELARGAIDASLTRQAAAALKRLPALKAVPDP